MKIKRRIQSMTGKQIAGGIVTILSLVLFLVITVWSQTKIKNLPDQQAAERWDGSGNAAQVSCYFAENVMVDEFLIMNFQQQFRQQLMEVLPQEQTAEKNDRRLFVDAYSSMGTITIISEKGQLTDVNAVGIGGDFFYFHPLQLLSGQYFSGDNLMKDSVIIDEEAAWQLFGSNDIAGKSVMIGEVPHYIAGVIKRPEGKFAESAGLDKTVVYVSHETLATYGKGSGICNYEIVSHNPVKGFVYTAVKEKMGVQEADMIVVENSSRYSIESLIPVILDFGTRSMQNAAVKFPYWENMGRGWEDVMAMVVLVQGLLLLVVAVIVIGFLWYRWRMRTWTWKDAREFISDRMDMLTSRIREKSKMRREDCAGSIRKGIYYEEKNHLPDNMCDRDDA